VERRGGGNGLVAVAIDRDRGSQLAMKWTIEHLLQRGQTVFLIHVNLKSPSAALHSPSEYIYIYIYIYVSFFGNLFLFWVFDHSRDREMIPAHTFLTHFCTTKKF
jgi:hypothetical protein